MQRLEVSGVVRPIYGSLGVKRLNNKYGCDPCVCTSLLVLFDTNGVHKDHVLQNQIFFRPSSVVMCTVENGLGEGGTLTGVSLGTLNMACVLIAQCR